MMEPSAGRILKIWFDPDSRERVFENARSFEAREESREKAAGNHMENPSAMTVLLVEPEKHPQVVEIGSDLKSLQNAVGGMIEAVYPFEENVGLIVNEEGKLSGLPLNRALKDENGEVLDVMAGTKSLRRSSISRRHLSGWATVLWRFRFRRKGLREQRMRKGPAGMQLRGQSIGSRK